MTPSGGEAKYLSDHPRTCSCMIRQASEVLDALFKILFAKHNIVILSPLFWPMEHKFKETDLGMRIYSTIPFEYSTYCVSLNDAHTLVAFSLQYALMAKWGTIDPWPKWRNCCSYLPLSGDKISGSFVVWNEDNSGSNYLKNGLSRVVFVVSFSWQLVSTVLLYAVGIFSFKTTCWNKVLKASIGHISLKWP